MAQVHSTNGLRSIVKFSGILGNAWYAAFYWLGVFCECMGVVALLPLILLVPSSLVVVLKETRDY